jgi:hypothetical protein
MLYLGINQHKRQLRVAGGYYAQLHVTKASYLAWIS